MPAKAINLEIPSQLGSEKQAMQAVVEYCQALALPRQRCNDIRTAVSEACVNAMEHGNKFSPDRKVYVSARTRAKVLEIEIRDEGAGFEHPKSQPDLEKKLQGMEPARGWGVFLIENLVDKVEYLPAKGHSGTRIRLSINLP